LGNKSYSLDLAEGHQTMLQALMYLVGLTQEDLRRQLSHMMSERSSWHSMSFLMTLK